MSARCNIFPTPVTLKCQQRLISQLPHDARCKQPTERLQGEEVEKKPILSFNNHFITSPSHLHTWIMGETEKVARLPLNKRSFKVRRNERYWSTAIKCLIWVIGSVEGEEGRRLSDRWKVLITTRGEEKEETQKYCHNLCLFSTNLKFYLKFSNSNSGTAAVNAWRVPLKVMSQIKLCRFQRYSQASWGRRLTALRSAACRPAGAPSPPSWFREAGQRKNPC